MNVRFIRIMDYEPKKLKIITTIVWEINILGKSAYVQKNLN